MDNKKITLIAIYEQVCADYNESLWTIVQRFSSNGLNGRITDQELITIYLFCTIHEKYHTQKQMWEHIRCYWHEWFPNLPSYQTFNNRLNRLYPAFEFYLGLLIERYEFNPDLSPTAIGDSCPIVTCAGNRKGKVAPELVSKTFSKSKKRWYWGCKLHVMGQKRKGKLPIPQSVGFSPASDHDLTIMEPYLENCMDMSIFLDKAYAKKYLSETAEQNGNQYYTPIKKAKNTPDVLQFRDAAYQKQVQTDVAKHRQPIESFFNWLHEKTGIQVASKVRSSKGLQLHIYGKLLAGFCSLIGLI